MNETKHTRVDRLLDLLAEEVAERLRAGPAPDSAPADDAPVAEEAPGDAAVQEAPAEPPSPEPPPDPEPVTELAADAVPGETEAALPEPASMPPAPSHIARLLGRLAIGLLALVVVINVPINRHGTTLATAMPDRRALVFRDGLVVKEADDPEIYVYEDGRFRWISSLKAFEMRGYTWADVHIVEDGFLAPYQMGPPIHVILKCQESPHIYRLEGEKKRWIVDIAAFEAEGYVWEDVEFVSCSTLRSLPDGETIPPDQGPPPQP
jgi:hypothetical protein